MSLSVIVVSFNTRDLLRRCLASLGEEHEIIVVDNASLDGSVEMVLAEFPNVALIPNETNVGFGAANNQGLKVMTGDLALLLNSDAYATRGAIASLLKVMEDVHVVCCGGRLINPGSESSFNADSFREKLTLGRMRPPEGEQLVQAMVAAQYASTQNSCANRLTLWVVFCEQSGLEKLFPGSPFFSPYWTTKRLLERSGPTEVEQVMGACLLMRPLERFDERFFLYCEDTELCKRLKSHGKVLYVPEAFFGHELGASSRTDRWRSVARYNRGKELYFALHVGKMASGACLILNRAGALFRFAGGLVATILTFGQAPRFSEKCSTFARVLFAPLKGPREVTATRKQR